MSAKIAPKVQTSTNKQKYNIIWQCWKLVSRNLKPTNNRDRKYGELARRLAQLGKTGKTPCFRRVGKTPNFITKFFPLLLDVFLSVAPPLLLRPDE